MKLYVHSLVDKLKRFSKVFHFGSFPDIHNNLRGILKGLPENHCCQCFLTLTLASEVEYFVEDCSKCEFSDCMGLHIINLLTPWCRIFLEKLTGLQLVKKFPAFHETQGSLPHSQTSTTRPYPGPAQSSPCTHIPPPGDPS